MKTSEVLFSVLDSNTFLTGELEFAGTLRIDGSLHGIIKASDALIVGESTEIRAEIYAGEIQIFGTVVGNIESTGRVEICPGGVLHGDVRTPQLIVREGGRFNGFSCSLRVLTPDSSLSEYQEPVQTAESAASPLETR